MSFRLVMWRIIIFFVDSFLAHYWKVVIYWKFVMEVVEDAS